MARKTELSVAQMVSCAKEQDSPGFASMNSHADKDARVNSTLMNRLGVPLEIREQRLGHSDASLTLGVYTHVASEDDERFVEQEDGILRPKRKTAQKWSLLSRRI